MASTFEWDNGQPSIAMADRGMRTTTTGKTWSQAAQQGIKARRDRGENPSIPRGPAKKTKRRSAR